MMGLPNWLHWSAWFIKSLTFILITIVLIVLLLKVRSKFSVQRSLDKSCFFFVIIEPLVWLFVSRRSGQVGRAFDIRVSIRILRDERVLLFLDDRILFER